MGTSDSLTWLKNDDRIVNITSKLITNKKLNEDECTYCLSVAIIMIKEFQKDRRKASYLEFGYFLILNYSLQSENYEPLFDLSTNLGFYPISKFILEHNLITDENINHYFVSNSLNKFLHQGITETLEQKLYRNELVTSESNDNCYVAPTSFGKSSMMVELIAELKLPKIFIIVPTKSLLTQTYKLINSTFNNRKVIFHDEMYGGEDNFIAIFTQERALRLLKNEKSMEVNALLIDEAHNLFESSSRSILLSRLIRRVRMRQRNSRIFYFSPLITNSDNLKFEENQEIDTKRIQFNIKEADIYEYRLGGLSYKYNRFLNKFFEYKQKKETLSYILEHAKSNNFFYLMAPRKVEKFAGLLANSLIVTNKDELLELANIISRNVHEDFYCVDLVKKGVLYIHGKLPDLIKEYLEYKFRENKYLKYIIANSVILEGVNLPIDNLYILNTNTLGAKELTNLIGRVNRLNEVFGGESPSLSKLKPSVHFINSEEFNRVASNMANKIETLKSGTFKDEIKNPTLLHFDIEKYDHIIEHSSSASRVESAKRSKGNAIAVIERENFLTEVPSSEQDHLKISFFESGLSNSYGNSEKAFYDILDKVSLVRNTPEIMDLDPIEKVYYVFINGLEDNLIDLSFVRLSNEKARNYYRAFVKNIHTFTLKEHINSTVKYFYSNAKETRNNIFYIGTSYGEVTRDNNEFGSRTYIDLSTKSHKELVNLALVKIKMESDFLSYKLNEYVSLLKEFNILSEDDYNIFIYGTAKKRNTDLTKLGLSGAIIKKFESENQLQNIEVDQLGHVTVNEEFKSYLSNQDDLIQFEIKKYISI